MQDEDIQKSVSAISLLAGTQAELIRLADATAEHSIMVLQNIVERCAAITPSKRFDPKQKIDEDITRFTAGAIGFCQTTTEELFGLWSRLVEHRTPAVSWKQHMGIGVTIGYIDDRPVHVLLRHVDVAGSKIIFYEATSTVVDYDMVRTFIELIAPPVSAYRNGRLNHSDTTNMVNLLPVGWTA